MSVGTDLREREDQAAGNADDSLNVGQRNSDATFNSKPGSHDDLDGYDRSADGLDDYDEKEFGKRKSAEYIDASGDKVKSNYNADDPEDSIDKAKDKEENPSVVRSSAGSGGNKSSFIGRMQGRLKRSGPTTGIVAILITVFGGMSIFMLPAALMSMMDRAASNESDATRTNILMRRSYIGGLFSKAACTIKVSCKITTMSEKQYKTWTDKGFKISPDKPGTLGRYKVTSITFPDGGPTVSSAKDFQSHIDTNPRARLAFDTVVNTKSGPFNAKYAKYRKIIAKPIYKLKKSSIFKASTDKDKAARTAAMNTDIDRHTGAVTDQDKLAAHAKKLDEKAKFSSKVGKLAAKMRGKGPGGVIQAANIVSTACLGYTLVKTTVASIKIKWYSDLIIFAMPMLQTFAQAVDQGNLEPERAEYIGDRLTWYGTPENAKTDYEKASIGKSAMDSQGIKAILFGDFEKLQEITKQYTGWWMSTAVGGSAIIGELERLAGGPQNLRDICLTANAASYAGLPFCAAGPVAATACAAGVFAAIFFLDDALKYASEQLAEPALQRIADADLSSNLRGVALGNALAAGIGLLMSDFARGSGLRGAINAFQASQFISATDDMYYKHTEELAQLRGQDEPLNPYNQYSFAGRIATALNPYRSNDGTAYSGGANLVATIFSPLKMLSTNAGALFHQPSQMNARPGGEAAASTARPDPNDPATTSAKEPNDRTDNCIDGDVHAIGLICDTMGDLVSISTPTVIDRAMAQSVGEKDSILETSEYMHSNGFINDEGKATGDTDPDGPEDVDNEKWENEYQYIMYKNYCTEDRVDPPGVTSNDLTTGSKEQREWWLYARCVGNDYNGKPINDPKLKEMLDHFDFYYNICETEVPMADEEKSCWDNATAATPAATTNTGDWVKPVVGTCGDGFGARGGAHKGVDISAGSGTSLVAPTSIKITFTGVSSDGSTGNSIQATATDGSNYSFTYMHMLGPSPIAVGQEVSKGQEVGKVGSTGDSSGPHLHIDVFPPGASPASYSGQTDPVPVFRDHGVDLC